MNWLKLRGDHVYQSARGNYPFPGYDQLAFLEVETIPDFDPSMQYPHARTARRYARVKVVDPCDGGGAGVFKVVDSAIAERHDKIEVRMSAAVERLIFDGERVVGVRANIAGKAVAIEARRGVVLACGGFESARPANSTGRWVLFCRRLAAVTPVTASAWRSP